VYVSPALAEDEWITFNAGSHEDAIRMSYREFENLVQPQVVPMAKHD
jgi:Ala-tRNA(Pro) deacylase